jgi:hypothetical protein
MSARLNDVSNRSDSVETNSFQKTQITDVVDAVYRVEPNPAYANNPFVRALPALPDDLQLQAALANLPKFDPSWRSLSKAERIQRLDILRTLVIPIPRLVKLARSMIKMMVTGYGPRAPFSVEDATTQRKLYEAQQSGSFVSVRSEQKAAQHSMALIGSSGCGKSYSMRTIASLFPSVIYHPELGKWQIPFIFIEMSYDGESLHTLASALFTELDRLLPGAGYYDLYIERRMNAEQQLTKALALCHEHGVGLIVVDEAQNERSIGNDDTAKTRAARVRADLNSKRESPLTKLLITASNITHVPLVFTGTLELKRKAQMRFSTSRRMAGRGSDQWLPFAEPLRTADGSMSKAISEFDAMMTILFRYQFLREPITYNIEWSDKFFDKTQGIPDIMVKLFEACQEAAISSGAETITPALVDRVFDDEFVTTEAGIRALRTGNKLLSNMFTDLVPEDEPDTSGPLLHQIPPPFASGTIISKAQRVARVPDPAKLAATASADALKYPSPKPVVLSENVVAQARSVAAAGTTLAESDWQHSLKP